ncbi:hypothetical protein AXF42_Ash011956 [Apostasia shenzhenica]|uniref:Tf2-1-like SH3-like domain-containing protein n=1 Tax=Apostasia shenzhenica TaxID=1088818 RepID=A0A2I0AWB0_9ASPA|nr:hypothetical protein AXF42_Ash011956 [Apostasia shenzhenica]
MTQYEALYGRKCKSPICWEEVGERKLTDPKLIEETTEKIKIIQERMKTAQSQQKSYADNHRSFLEFLVGEVFLKISPMKGVMRFGKKGKLSPRYIGPFEILERVGNVAYRLALPPKMMDFHNVSITRKYKPDPYVHSQQDIKIRRDVLYRETYWNS